MAMPSSSELLNKNIPRYLQLSGLFRRRIESGMWPLGLQIPTVDELSAECGAARATIRQALGLLESEGLISRHRAKGSFVEQRPQDLFWLSMESDWSGLLTHREDARIEVLSTRKGEKPPYLAHPIGNLTESYLHLRRRHWRDDSVFLLADLYIDETIAESIDPVNFTVMTALRLIAGVKGIDIRDARQTLHISSTDLELAELMKLPLNAPLAAVDRTAVDQNGDIVLISNGMYRGDIVRVDTRLK